MAFKEAYSTMRPFVILFKYKNVNLPAPSIFFLFPLRILGYYTVYYRYSHIITHKQTHLNVTHYNKHDVRKLNLTEIKSPDVECVSVKRM